MARKIDADSCVGCQTCMGACPCEAIVADGDKCKIDPAKCADCGACEAACPVGAIKAE